MGASQACVVLCAETQHWSKCKTLSTSVNVFLWSYLLFSPCSTPGNQRRANAKYLIHIFKSSNNKAAPAVKGNPRGNQLLITTVTRKFVQSSWPFPFCGMEKSSYTSKTTFEKERGKKYCFPTNVYSNMWSHFFLLRLFLNTNKRNMGKISATSIFHWFYSLHIGSYVWSSSEHFPWSQPESFTLKHQINETIYCPNFKVTSRTRWIRGCMFDLIVQFIQLLLKVYLTLLTFLWFPSKFTHYLKWL